MAIGESFRAFRRGEGFERSFGYLWLSQEDIDRGRDATNKLDELNRKAFEVGKINDQEYQERTARLHSTDVENLLTDPNSSPLQGFKEGFEEGAANVQSAIKETIRAPITFGLGAIPWQAWLIVGLFVAWKLGAFKKLQTA